MCRCVYVYVAGEALSCLETAEGSFSLVMALSCGAAGAHHCYGGGSWPCVSGGYSLYIRIYNNNLNLNIYVNIF